MDIRLIDLFNVALFEDEEMVDFTQLNQEAMKYGYIIHPKCCTKSVWKWLDTKTCNWNSTFYKTWEDVTSKNRLELAVDQLVSYAINGSGGNFNMNDHDYSLVPDIRKYKVIYPITKEELYSKCIDMVTSGIALKQSTMMTVCDFIIKYPDLIPSETAIDDIKNKEAQIYLCDKMGITPWDKFALLRYIVYKVTGETQIIKNKHIIMDIENGNPFDLNVLSEGQLEGLASIFFRYKPIFLGLKSHNFPNQKYIVNKLRRMADKLHKPMEMGFWEVVVNKYCNVQYLKHKLQSDNPSNFKLINLIQTIRENRYKIGAAGDIYSMYQIRNGKVWFKKMENPPALDQKYIWWDILENILYKELVRRLREKACTVKFPEGLNLACPTSEKNFIGNIPFGSNYKLDKHNMIGIYWRGEWGTIDFDLSFVDYNGNKIGWNSDYVLNTNCVIYSGDMVTANPEASEVIYIKGDCPDGMIKVNRFNGVEGSKFILSVAQNQVERLPRNYMIDPNTIKFQTEMQSIDRESFVGFINNGILYMCDFKSGDSRVSTKIKTDDYGRLLNRKALSFIDLKQLLIDAGFKERVRDIKNNPIRLDLSIPNKDTLIKLFS